MDPLWVRKWTEFYFLSIWTFEEKFEILTFLEVFCRVHNKLGVRGSQVERRAFF